MATFTKSTATIAAWNLAGFHGITDERLQRQAEGLSLIDAEFITLVEVPTEQHLIDLKTRLADDHGLVYDHVFVDQQASVDHSLNIAVLFKHGITVEDAALLDGSNGGDPTRRKALTANVKIDRFDFHLIAVHLKSGRDKASQELRDDNAR